MADTIRATPRNPVLGLFSDITQGGLDYLRDPRFRQSMMQLPAPVRPFGMGAVALPGLFESTGFPKTLERASYGQPLTNIGMANVPLLKPETADLLMTFAPMVGPAIRATKGLPVGMGIKSVGKTGLPSPKSLTMPSVPTVDQMKQYGRTEVVPLSKAVSFQSARNWEKFKEGKGPGDLVAGYGDRPLALRLETGEYVIYDGNHRTDLALQKGKTELPMHVIDVKSYDPAHAGRKPVPLSMSDDELLNSLLGDNRQQSPYPQQAALDLAQQRAALPVSQGGLGLPAGNTAEQRAAAMGFNTDAYHGTNKDFLAFDKNKRGSATDQGWYGSGEYSSPSANGANAYAMTDFPNYKESANIMPLLLKNPESITNKHGYITEYVTREPEQIRSRFAAFDPFRRSAAIAATMGVAAPDLLANELDYPSNPMYTDPLGYTIR